MISWITPSGNLGTLIERISTSINLQSVSDAGPVTYSVIAGSLPRGLRLIGDKIQGSPVEVKVFTTSKFVIRATDQNEVKDRTFTIGIDGTDSPIWLTKEGFLNVGPAKSYFVLDNAQVNFQLEAADTDNTAGDELKFYLLPNGGLLPPGLTLSQTGIISGFTDPIFALEYLVDTSGGYDTAPLDAIPLDFADANSNGFDTFFYDTVTFDYNEPSRVPRRLSRIYTFIVAVSDGINTENRLFKIYVVTEEFLKADNSITQVDTNLFQADNSSNRTPIWITESNLGKIRANNYVTIFLDLYDPTTLTGTISYFALPTNPDATVSQFPPGLVIDSITGEIAGVLPYQARISKEYKFTVLAVNFPRMLADIPYVLKGAWSPANTYQANDAVQFLNEIYVCIQPHRNRLLTDSSYWIKQTTSAEKTFTVEVIGEIDSAVEWISQSNLGSIKPNQPSTKFVSAKSLLAGGSITYQLVGGTLPPGLLFLPTGIIEGKVKQFGDSKGKGLTRLYEKVNSTDDFSSTFDSGTTSFDKRFSFTIQVKDNVNLFEVKKVFFITIDTNTTQTFANLYVKAFQNKEKRLAWYDFITDSTIFNPQDIYRQGDKNFGIQTTLKVLIFAGIESTKAEKYVQAMSRNHYQKRLLFNSVKVAKAKDIATQETIYELIYVDVEDEYETNGKSISQVVELPNSINSKVLVSYDAIKIDSNIPLVSDSDHQRIFPNSIKNMRKQIAGIGNSDREFLPLWMRSIQDFKTYETGYVKALPLCYCNPGRSAVIMAKIKASNFDFKSLDFVADRYIIDILDGNIEDKYLAFPQRGEKIP
jgi:hypothetical protein